LQNIHKKLNKSIEKEFYFEALFILASLIENMIKQKILIEIKERLTFETAIDKAYNEKLISENLYDLLHNWREERNSFVHNLISKNIEEDSLKDFIFDGKNILNKIEESIK